MKICPFCGNTDVIMFDSDNDLCRGCDKYFPAISDVEEICGDKNMENTTEVMYSLRHKTTGNLARYSVTSNEGRDYCNDLTYTLSQYGEEDWMCKSPHSIDCILSGVKTPWFNSDYEMPVVDICINDYVPVKISTTKTIEHVFIEPSLLILQESILAFDYKEKMGIIPDHTHRYLVCYLVEDYTKYSDKIGAKIHTMGTAYRILVWAGVYEDKNMLILSNDY